MFNPNASTSVRASAGIDVAHFLGAYSAAVGVSAFVFVAQIGIILWIAGATSMELTTDLLFQTAIMFLLLAVLSAYFAFWMALVPAVTSIVLARRLGFESAIYYLICGALTVILLAPISAWLLPYDDLIEIPPTFWERCVRIALVLTVPAASGAIAFWYFERRPRGGSPPSDGHMR